MSEIAWLAGLIDGEGSVGITIAKRSNEGRLGFSANVQLCMTCERTIEHARSVIECIGAVSVGYSYREKDPRRHLDAHYIRVNRLKDIFCVGSAVAPFAITKAPQWMAMLEYVRSRLSCADLDELGRVKRGGPRHNGFTDREIELAHILRNLNARGPRAKKKEALWLAKLGFVKSRPTSRGSSAKS